ncbi:hypothetical protein CPAV1605_1381 [seawater metagenome]|uniref:Uncharacterized protein n=1 Tax=seawater metagenome TaxID=1561972 RepID=A0A5E8CL88_9ZZZZ
MNNYFLLLVVELIFVGLSLSQKISTGFFYANGLKLSNSNMLLYHVISSSFMWICGHLQFWILTDKNIFHRIIGYIYSINALISGITSILLAFNSKHIYGFLITYSLCLGGFNMLYYTINSIYQIRQKKYNKHKMFIFMTSITSHFIIIQRLSSYLLKLIFNMNHNLALYIGFYPVLIGLYVNILFTPWYYRRFLLCIHFIIGSLIYYY